MRAWERVRVRGKCGKCGRELAAGEPVLVFALPRGTRTPLRLIRCDQCEGPAPPNLPALVELLLGVQAPPALRPWAEVDAERQVRTLRRMAGEREPGEEG